VTRVDAFIHVAPVTHVFALTWQLPPVEPEFNKSTQGYVPLKVDLVTEVDVKSGVFKAACREAPNPANLPGCYRFELDVTGNFLGDFILLPVTSVIQNNQLLTLETIDMQID